MNDQQQLTHNDKVHNLNVMEIYPSISGEAGPAFPQGAACIFIRLQGCPLSCVWCDTPNSLPYTKATIMSVGQVVAGCGELGIANVVLTGGEPLSQVRAPDLIRGLLVQGYRVQVETSGAVQIPALPPMGIGGGIRASRHLGWSVDIKMPDSGEAARNKNPTRLIPGDGSSVYFKFVCASEADIQYALTYIEALPPGPLPDYFALSPVNGDLELARKITDAIGGRPWRYRSSIVLSLQIHKYINMP